MNKFKGIYLIQEQGCLNPYSGAFHHISMGLQELSKYFDIRLFLNSVPISLADYTEKTNPEQKRSEKIKKVKHRGYVYGTVKDIRILIKNLRDIPKLYSCIRIQKLSFVYERIAYLDFAGLIVCKVLRIPHCYEVNGIMFKTRDIYYKSLFKPLAKFLEKRAYKASNHNFFVGSYGNYWKLNSANWTNVENGIESKYVSDSKVEKTLTGKLEFCFVGRYAKHQNIECLVEAINYIKHKRAMRIHLIGTGLESIAKNISEKEVEVIMHGYLTSEPLLKVLNQCDVGLICGTPPYQSCMKLHDYALSSCLVLAPMVDNLKTRFANSILFFDDDDANDLGAKINQVIDDPSLVRIYGKLIHEEIITNYTWGHIFHHKVNVIKALL